MNRLKMSLLVILVCAGGVARADLASYLAKPEPAYKWEKTGVRNVRGGTITELSMTSLVWHGITWKHSVDIFRPEGIKHPEFCGLLNTGGNPSPDQDALGMQAAKASGTVFAIIYNIPNQPLFGGKVEDQIIAYTWQQFLKTGDEDWPLHFPMAKAVIKAMDSVQACARKEKWTPITSFLITGASKRGWTTWLVGASRDKRVKAICPMVIDTLNLPKQIPHQLEAYGAPSEEVKDYTVAGLAEQLKTPRGHRLIELEDPYSYRAILTMPKLLINGSNDPYWSQDSLNLYWDDLKGKKWVLYCPNSGHDLANGVSRILATLPAFVRMIAGHEKWPNMHWVYTDAGDGAKLTVTSDIPIKSARLWHCDAPTQDFRKHKYTSDPMEPASGGGWTEKYPTPPTGYASIFGELTYDIDGHSFTLSTQIKILGTKKAAALMPGALRKSGTAVSRSVANASAIR